MTLKASLEHLLHDLELADSGPQLLSGAQAALGTLKIVEIAVNWREKAPAAANWCEEQWRPLVDVLIGWAPALFEACMDQLMLSDAQKVLPNGAFQHHSLFNYSARETVKFAASRKWPDAVSFSQSVVHFNTGGRVLLAWLGAHTYRCFFQENNLAVTLLCNSLL